MTSPKVWGRHFWTTLHVSALGYPDTATLNDMDAYKDFYTIFGNILPCKKCSSNYKRHLQELPLGREELANRDKLFAWTVDLHNIVNRDTGKPQWNYDYAKEFYLSGNYNECHIDDPNAIKNDAWRLILIFMIILNVLVICYLVYATMK